MNPKYKGSDALLLLMDRQQYHFLYFICPQREELMGIAHLFQDNEIVDFYKGVNEAATYAVSKAVRKANRGHPIDFEHILD
ncbi:MAG: hypothetical protein AABW71_01660 [Nanoarchaeota archaeon]